MGLNRVLSELNSEISALKSIGVKSLIDNLININRSWTLSKSKIATIGKNESLSDTNSYLTLVELATEEDGYFEKFKSNLEYRKILEHVSRRFGQDYWEIIRRYDGNTPRLSKFIETDFCKPFRFTYKGIGRVSSTNLRYAKIALDIEQIFGSTKLLNIVEVGIGYGGQAIAINELNGCQSYKLVDLPQVQKLAQKYFQAFYPVINNKVSSTPEHWDLAISNYAFSELSREIQEDYLEKYIKKSKRGYVIFNDITNNQFSTVSVSEFIERVPGAELLREVPLTYPRNRLVVWGHSKTGNLIQD